jgi:hypothetical protein
MKFTSHMCHDLNAIKAYSNNAYCHRENHTMLCCNVFWCLSSFGKGALGPL